LSDSAVADAKGAVGAPGAMIVIISGPSGVGKDTIIRWLKERAATPERHFVVTYKTRAPRAGEVEGVDYQFVDVAEFARLMEEGQLLEASEVHGHWSGTPRDQVEQALSEGRDAVLKIDVQGAEKVKALVPGVLRIFVAPPSEEVREERIVGRGTESAEDLARRKSDAEIEMRRQAEYDYVVVNETGKADKTARKIDRIIRQEHARHPRRRISL
jgi:guanylate kinase